MKRCGGPASSLVDDLGHEWAWVSGEWMCQRCATQDVRSEAPCPSAPKVH